MSAFVRDTNESGFTVDVIKASDDHPILVDFWASWCGPCRTLGPILEALAEEYQGAFTLVKVDADNNGALAQEYGVRGLPTVKVFRNGKVVDEFVGALSEVAVREFIDKHLDGPADQLMREALDLAKGNPEAGIELLRRACELDPDNHPISLALAELLLANNERDEAERLLSALPANIATGDQARLLRSRIGLQKLFEADGPANDPAGDLFSQAGDAVNRGELNRALDLLGGIIEKQPGWQNGRAREAMIALFALPEIDSEKATTWRRKIASLMH